MPRVDKAAAAASDSSEGRTRWSTSSVPRGRSSSPSEFIRVFRDSRVSKGESDNRVVSSAGKKNGTRDIRDCKENGGFDVELGKMNGTCEVNDLKVQRSEENLSGFKGLNSSANKEVNLSSNLIKSNEFDDVCNSNSDSKVFNGGKCDKLRVGKSGSDTKYDCLKESGEKSCGQAKVLENLKEKGLIEEGKCNRVGVKYPSKLHEKLAFLEGKVRRIASDIKRTKEMLDMNNPDASKVILTDIQDKISGIEKVMGHVAGDSSKSGGKVRGENVVVEKSQSKKLDDVKGSVKGLNSEELEARLFPHHKLLRNRTSLKASSGSSQSHDESKAVGSCCELKVEDKGLSPIGENPIALEFLASLSKEDANTMVTGRDANVGFESFEVPEMGDTAASGKQDSSNTFNWKSEEELVLTTDETLDEFDDQENKNAIVIGGEVEDTCVYQVNEIGTKNSTGGWFVSEGESVLLAHDDGSCSFYDIANSEVQISAIYICLKVNFQFLLCF